jgi:hypothetical protein
MNVEIGMLIIINEPVRRGECFHVSKISGILGTFLF